jgi:fibronectin type 3 domain-containing protein
LATAADLAQPQSTPQTPTGFTSRSQIISSLFLSIKTAFLDWDSNQDPVIGYNIYRTTTSHSDYQKLNSSPLAQTYYMEQNLDPDTSYYYVLTAVDSLGSESNFSKEVVDDEGNENTSSIEGRVPSRNMLRTILAIRKINPLI